MNNPNFGAILDKRPSEIERPKPLPVGTYDTIIIGLPRYDKSAKKQTEFVEFQHKFTGARDDVDEESLKEALGDRSLNDVTMKNTFYLTEGSAWRLKDFLRDLGFDVDSEDMSMREMVEQTAGKAVGVSVKHVPSQDGQSVFAQIDRTVVIE